ncbi:hypothetical protein BDR03DRAFT_1095190 [Suillus americanus]|nr:hypothetical protein BDR03DRAFT_1095190 [Suillus americanus]
MTTNSNLSTVSDILGVLQDILARSEVIIPNLESPYSRFPNTDQSAPHKEQSIGAIITEHQQQLDTVLHEISGLESVMDSIKNLKQQLLAKKNKITQSMILHKGLTSGLWRLPTEVVSQIFHFCLPGIDEFEPPSGLDPPVLLTGVCRRWRAIAVATPSLWCRPSLLFCPGDQWKRQAFCYDSWLQRSQGRPLSLTLCWDDCPYDSDKIRILLRPYVNQILSLCIHFSFRENQPELLLDSFPALHELTILASDMTALRRSISQLPLTVTSLKLIASCFTHQMLSSYNPVWTHLTNIVMEVLEPFVVLNLLKLCPNLSSLMIGIMFGNFRNFAHLTHNNLRSLSIAFRHTDPLLELFKVLSLPNLRVLETSSSNETERWPHEEFKAFMALSICSLESLVLGAGVTTTHGQRAEYIDLIPSLKVVVDPSRPNYYDL